MSFPLLKKSRTPLTLVNACMSSTSKSSNHYETLKVSQNATQEEIKTAYYNMSKQYHPDINKSVEAKEKFRDVSEAYETLGNYKIRRQYDKGMTARGIHVKPTTKDEKDHKHMAFYKSRMRSYPKPIITADSKVFDFDAWTRAHYGDTLRRTIKKREAKINIDIRRKGNVEREIRTANELPTYVGISVLLFIAIILAGMKDNFDDIPSEQRKEQLKR